MSEKQNNLREILLHGLGILGFLSLPFLFSPDLAGDRRLFSIPPFQRDFSVYVLLLGVFYLSYLTLIPKLFFHKHYWLFALILVALYAIIAFLPGLLFGGFHPMPPRKIPGDMHTQRPFQPTLMMTYARHVPVFFMVLLIAFLMKISERYKKAEQQKTLAELSYLKAQVNPHFLFNTLNSIYALTLEKSDAASDAIVKLSGMMRYVLNETQHEFVSLEQEVEYITDYIGLQKLRLGESIPLEYEVTGNTAGKRIVPMLLIPFVENAFKYGVNAEEDSNIRISIHIEGDKLLFETVNNKIYTRPSIERRSSIGIRNTRERLEMLYPGNYSLQVINGEKDFRVSLALHLR